MKRRKLHIVFIIIAFFDLQLMAQDIHFSQFNETPQLLNPAATGVYNGYIRGIVNYKNQWSAMGNAFNTESASIDAPVFDYNERKAHLGVGVNFFNDNAGDAKLGLTQLNLCLSGILPINRKTKLSMGISIGSAQGKANLNSLVWANQYDGKGFDPNLNSGENITTNSHVYSDIGAGIYYEFSNRRGSIERDDEKRFAIGVAGFHLNRPLQNYFAVTEKLYRKWVVNFTSLLDISGSRFALLPSAVYYLQGSSSEINVGCALNYRINNGTKVTGFYTESGIALGLHYRYKDAIIPQVYYQAKDIAIGISYDVTISRFKTATKMNGGIEVSLKYHLMKGAMFKQKNVI